MALGKWFKITVKPMNLFTSHILAPGKPYNPLFLYRHPDLGTTHLMHAVADQMLVNRRKVRVIYKSMEKVTNEFIQAIPLHLMAKFRTKDRSLNIFVPDDIHFLSGKERKSRFFCAAAAPRRAFRNWKGHSSPDSSGVRDRYSTAGFQNARRHSIAQGGGHENRTLLERPFFEDSFNGQHKSISQFKFIERILPI
jgi:hypothetical protein